MTRSSRRWTVGDKSCEGHGPRARDRGATGRSAGVRDARDPRPRLYRLALGVLGDAAGADDATQRALVAVWRDLPRLLDPGRFDAWSYRLLVRATRALDVVPVAQMLTAERRDTSEAASGVARPVPPVCGAPR